MLAGNPGGREALLMANSLKKQVDTHKCRHRMAKSRVHNLNKLIVLSVVSIDILDGLAKLRLA